MQTQASMSELDERLSAYFDGELEEGAMSAFAAEIEQDPELGEHLADLSFLREMVVGDLEHQAERVPEARFEQIWDGFERSLERESRLQEAAEAPPGLIERLMEWIRPRRMPLAALGAAGALVFVFARSAGEPELGASDAVAEASPDEANQADEGANTREAAASDAEPAVEDRATQPSPALAVAPEPTPDAEMFPQPEPGEAEIRRIEFGGRSGTISRVQGSRGTTTVIWVNDQAPIDSERSL